jgi:AcrR family transcriptional regulator
MSTIDLEQFRAPRPRRADGARNFDAILAAAREAIATDGVDVPLELVAERAGVGIATLYRNFPTREALVEHLYVDEIAAIVADSAAVEGLEPWPALVEWSRRFAVHIDAKAQLASAIDPDGAVYDACVRSIIGTATPIVERARAAGELADDTAVDDLTRGVFGIATMPVDDDAQRLRILDAFLLGLRVRR